MIDVRNILTKDIFCLLFERNDEAVEAEFFSFIRNRVSQRASDELHKRYNHFQGGGRKGCFDDNFFNSYIAQIEIMPEAQAMLLFDLEKLLRSLKVATAGVG
jgi:hypothetical protein